ncbi:hypothetical protein [Bacillus sp. FJAT-49736]|uniref:hypothetical protein n=1 Tax=Bacillus sp. FJAT-49736 TaxID=2833582 RepID=UPI001BC97325|nr:hypothetical protein [Bacillus sp. FJAT-49736]MBS4173806.1 hypothetical protein [Bacillus sp. FJAT-49736]
MKRSRYLLCILLAAALLYYAIPQLHFTASSQNGVFAFVWAGFALLVIAGNLSALLYSPKKKSYSRSDVPIGKRIRSH